jgi:hypothetical protein
MSAHAAPLHCPYCAGEDLRPHGDKHGAWECRECLRAFSVSFLGLLAPSNQNLPTESSVPTTSTGGPQ